MIRGRRTLIRRIWTWGALFLIGWVALPAQAELRVLEVVGAVPVSASSGQAKMPKEQAIDEALLEGVSRIAEEFLIEADPASAQGPDQRDRLRAVLGPDMVPYTRSFRIVEDQGERPVLFTAATEYVVVVSVEVETERIREQLIRAGLLAEEGQGIVQGYELRVTGVRHYLGYQALVELLESEAVGVKSIVPREVGSESLSLAVQADFDAAMLLERLRAAAPSNLEIHSEGPTEKDPSQAAGDLGGGSAGVLPSDAMGTTVARREEVLEIDVVWRPIAEERSSEDSPGASR